MMSGARKFSTIGTTLALATFVGPRAVFACAACFGQSDSPMAAGMNWGIFSLLAMIVVVLAGVAAFFVFLAKRSARLAKDAAAAAVLSQSIEASTTTRAGAGQIMAIGPLARGGLNRPSTLAQRRQACARPPSEPGRSGASIHGRG